jgi:hypothetical protein
MQPPLTIVVHLAEFSLFIHWKAGVATAGLPVVPEGKQNQPTLAEALYPHLVAHPHSDAVGDGPFEPTVEADDPDAMGYTRDPEEEGTG